MNRGCQCEATVAIENQTDGSNGINLIQKNLHKTRGHSQNTYSARSAHTKIVYNKNKLHKIKFKRTAHHPEQQFSIRQRSTELQR